jgi:cytochrome c-type biogenesis protein CcmE
MTQAKFLIAGALILGSIGFLMYTGISESMVTYYDVPQLLEKSARLEERGVRLTGQVKPGSVNLYRDRSRVDFLVYDQASTLSIPVTYQGDIPDTFQERAEVVVEGRYDPDELLFHAGLLFAKCPSKYEQQEEIDRPQEVTDLPHEATDRPEEAIARVEAVQ